METLTFSPTPPASVPDLDRACLTELYGGDAAYAAELFDLFLTAIVPGLQTLGVAIERENWAEVSRLAHKYKPTLRMVGLTALEEHLHVVQLRAETAPDAAELATRWVAFTGELANWLPLLNQELQTLQHQANAGSAPL